MDSDPEQSEDVLAGGPPPGEPVEAGPADGAANAGEQGRALAPRIEVGFAEGDLTVRGADGPQVRVNPAGLLHDAYVPEPEAGGTLRFARLPEHAELVVPHGAVVTLREVEGDLRVQDIAALSAGWIGKDASLVGVDSIDLGRVEGDLSARACGGLRVREVESEVHLDGLREAPTLGRIGGDLEVHGAPGLEAQESIGGEVEIEGCTGEAYIRGPVGGDLVAEGCAGALHVGTVGSDLKVRMCGSLTVDGSVGGDCDVAEMAGDVELRGAVGGDLKAQLVGALSAAGAVGGDAELATVARATRLRTVGGDLTAETLAGPVTVGTVGGDARLRTCLGPVQVHMIGGDATIQRATGSVGLVRVGGDAQLDTPLAAGAEYQVRAAGDIRLRVRGEVNARFVAQTQGGEIRTRLPLAVERGRRRNLVGVLGRGDATVTLNSDGGDIFITASDGNEEDMMGDEYVGSGTGSGDQSSTSGTTGTGGSTGSATDKGSRTWETRLGGHKFRVRWDPGAGAEGDPDDPDGMGAPKRNFGFEWEHNPEDDRRSAQDFERQMDDLRDKAEQVARRAAEQARRYADRAARRARETDWEAIGREVRSAIERAMGDLEDTVNQFRRDFDSRRWSGGSGGSGGGSSSSSRPSPAQRVRIEQDEEGDAYSSAYGSGSDAGPGMPPTGARMDAEAQRRAILEELRAGTISLDEAERRLNDLR